MSFLKALREKLSSEDYTKVMDALGDDFDADLVPRTRLNAVIKQRNKLREDLAGQPQGREDIDDDDDDDDDEGTPPAKKQKKQKQTKQGGGTGDGAPNLEELQQQHQAELDGLKIRYSAVDKLRAAGAKDPDLILNAGLLDVKLAKVEKNGTVVWPDGDKDPFNVLKADKDRSYLFGADGGAGGGAPSGTGKEGGAGGAGGPTMQEAYAAAIKAGDSVTQARLIREAHAQGVTLS